jgi:hypothetical protein
MNDESARPGALPNQTQPHCSRLVGRAFVHLTNGYVYSGWVEVEGGAVTINGRLRTTIGPAHCPSYIHRGPVRRTYPLRTVRRIDWAQASR